MYRRRHIATLRACALRGSFTIQRFVLRSCDSFSAKRLSTLNFFWYCALPPTCSCRFRQRIRDVLSIRTPGKYRALRIHPVVQPTDKIEVLFRAVTQEALQSQYMKLESKTTSSYQAPVEDASLHTLRWLATQLTEQWLPEADDQNYQNCNLWGNLGQWDITFQEGGWGIMLSYTQLNWQAPAICCSRPQFPPFNCTFWVHRWHEYAVSVSHADGYSRLRVFLALF